MGKIWFPLQRAIRTAVAVFLGAVTVLGVIVVVAPQVVTALQDVLPGPVIAWATGAIATLTAISAAVSRVMAIPQVDALLLTAAPIPNVPAARATTPPVFRSVQRLIRPGAASVPGAAGVAVPSSGWGVDRP